MKRCTIADLSPNESRFMPETLGDATIVSGGVYDDLFSEFSHTNKSACGFAANITTLVEILENNN